MKRSVKLMFTKRIEFKEFIKEFVYSFQKLDAGMYRSEKKKYEIYWLDGIEVGNRKVWCGRVLNGDNHTIELDKNFFEETDVELLYFTIVCMILRKRVSDQMEVDRLSLEHFILDTDGDYERLLKSFEKLLEDKSNAELTKQRIKAIKEMRPTKEQLLERKRLSAQVEREKMEVEAEKRERHLMQK